MTSREWAHRLWGTIRRARTDRDLENELSAHLELAADDERRRGNSVSGALRAARLRAGGVAQAMEAQRDQRGLARLENLARDVRLACRTLRNAPGFTVVAVLTLALAIGATTTIFSVVDGVLLRPFPYAEMNRIMILGETTRSGLPMSVAWPNFVDWREQQDVFEHFGVYRGSTVNLTGSDQPERLIAAMISSEVSPALGIKAAIGRGLTPAEDRPTADRVVTISDRLWRSHFNADPSIVGRSVTLDGSAYTIVGVMPPGMRFPSRLTDVWLPLGLFVTTFPDNRGNHPGLTVVAKLWPASSVDRANTEMDAIARRLEKQYPLTNADHAILVTPYYEQVVGSIRPMLVMLLAAVGFVLLIACANMANLTLARADRRQREIALRSALGASRFRVVQQLLVESLLVSFAGGALGALLAIVGVKALIASRPSTIPRIDLLTVDTRVLAFTALVSIVTGLAFGIAPAVRASSVDFLSALKDGARSSAGVAVRHLRSTLVVAEVALALMLLVGAMLTLKSLDRLMAIDLGFAPAHVVTMRVTLPQSSYPDTPRWTAFHELLVRRVSALPSIQSVGLNSNIPLGGSGSESDIRYEGQPMPKSPTDTGGGTTCLFQASTPEFLKSMGIPLIRGRHFTDRDTANTTLVAIVDETLVRKFFPGVDAIGKRIAFEFRGAPPNPQPIWREIIGVVRHVQHYGLATEPPFVQVYTPLAQPPLYFQDRRPTMILVARTALDPESVVSLIRREVATIDPNIPVYGVQTMQAYVDQATEQPRMSVTLLGAFSVLALVLATLGIYGVLSYLVTLRRQEIGIRMALGATARDVLGLIVGHGMMLTAIGIAVGLAGSWVLTELTRSFLYGVSPHDPLTYLSVAALLATIAAVASYVPGHRAVGVDPATTLRAE
ncbi:MAG TPA: ABC transporter permease [Vicinamibacterales bacterium]|jgi:putative ABC transport system permease protein|nr:ABC transporter permease [Vicinamibacterales bacterium]